MEILWGEWYTILNWHDTLFFANSLENSMWMRREKKTEIQAALEHWMHPSWGTCKQILYHKVGYNNEDRKKFSTGMPFPHCSK